MATALLEPMLRPEGNFRKCSMRRYGLGWEFGTLSVWASAPSHSRLPATIVANSTAARTAILIRSFPRDVLSAKRHYTRAPGRRPEGLRLARKCSNEKGKKQEVDGASRILARPVPDITPLWWRSSRDHFRRARGPRAGACGQNGAAEATSICFRW